ncbi:MAG: type II secretion system minor pseudopilin GspH [Proteobacteria bacterium]|nr:type II secretion system minor pseudopilin GspH [Pseudomonadota bacterium]MDA0993853.1 type II secretion system minor pseudopilin GspH [Pseudomonadota bacterium]
MSIRTDHNSENDISDQLGFTLVEILVVVVIVGIISAVALLSFGLLGGNDRDLERDARRLSSLIEVVNDDAVIQGRDFGLEVMRSGYRWVEYDPFLDQWFEVTDDDVMRGRQLADGTEFELYIEEHRVLLQDEAKNTKDDEEQSGRNLTEDYLPHILVLSSGDITPFELRLFRISDRAELTLTMSLTGEMKIEDDDPTTF